MRAIAAVAASIAVCAGLVISAEADARRNPIDLTAFMTGLACTESGGRYDAENPRTGAMGKYQIMPGNWVAWSGRYLGNRWATPTPRNQEFVARSRITDLFDKHSDWSSVAHWWLTGNAGHEVAVWSPGATRYTQRVMNTAAAAASPRFVEEIPARCFPGVFPDPAVRTEPFPRAEIRGNRVNVRVGPGYEHKAFTAVRRGDTVPILAKGRDPRGKPWVKIGLSRGRTGWIAAWFAVRR